ncbi:hypothetical protein [Schleiferilactobacillus harbinensis]|uniref:Uncharacterized protein n=1 Tax=Schleiferilactobacillus harbinensis TaxID=304207 RepID=A0A5P8M9N5_9LACO|nr:hypothetical protein [Schleiferilactobacillus harbinensis]QFR25057.1 hypothetical protein D1010_17625 [Schleiferilactobacillus harbinensis]
MMDNKKYTMRRDQLEDIYKMAEQIVALKTDDPAFALGQAQGMADSIKSTIEWVTNNATGKRVAKGKEEDSDEK